MFKDVQWIGEDKFKLTINGIEVTYKVEVKPGVITSVIIKGLNYNSLCTLDIDTRKNRLLSLQCIGFEKDVVKKIIISKLAVQIPPSL